MFLVVILVFAIITPIVDYVQAIQQQKRSLIFPKTTPTRVQFIGGIGIPVEDLSYESVISGYVLKAEYFLPTKAEELTTDYLKPQSIHKRSTRLHKDTNHLVWGMQSSNSSNHDGQFKTNQRPRSLPMVHRWAIYKGVELLISRSGHPGHECVLRSICEISRFPFHSDGGLLVDLIHILLLPSSSIDDMTSPTHHNYVQAEEFGKIGLNCETIYGKCKISLLDKISHFLHMFDK